MDGGDGFPVVAGAVKFRHAHAAQTQSGNRQSLVSQFACFHHLPGFTRFDRKIAPNPFPERSNFLIAYMGGADKLSCSFSLPKIVNAELCRKAAEKVGNPNVRS